MGITKTYFMRGMQCPKMLWFDKHKPKCILRRPSATDAITSGHSAAVTATCL